MDMFCYQCEQTARGKGCDYLGICGKEPEVAALQDIIVHQAKGVGYLAHQARRMGRVDDGPFGILSMVPYVSTNLVCLL